ncbi:MAG: hypothetical protein JWN71_2746 [Xanthobacteraceae bacterium]|nr:hypothetical protein [Xanthobacteraceae bacterium]
MNDNLARGDDLTREAWATREVGFERPAARRPALRHRAICWQLVTTLTLALSTLLAATVLTLGYTRADTLSLGDGASLALERVQQKWTPVLRKSDQACAVRVNLPAYAL